MPKNRTKIEAYESALRFLFIGETDENYYGRVVDLPVIWLQEGVIGVILMRIKIRFNRF